MLDYHCKGRDSIPGDCMWTKWMVSPTDLHHHTVALQALAERPLRCAIITTKDFESGISAFNRHQTLYRAKELVIWWYSSMPKHCGFKTCGRDGGRIPRFWMEESGRLHPISASPPKKEILSKEIRVDGPHSLSQYGGGAKNLWSCRKFEPR